MNLILNTATVLFETIILFMFYSQFMVCKTQAKIPFLAIIAAVFAATIVNSIIIKPPFITTLFTIIICFAATFFYKSRLTKKMFCAAIFVVLAMVSEMLTASIMFWFKIGTPETIMQDGSVVRLGGMIASKIVFLILLRVVMLFDTHDKHRVYSSYGIGLISVPLMNIVMLISICYFFNGIDDKISMPFTIATICAMYINLLVFYLFEKLADVADLKNKNNILEEQVVIQAKLNETEKSEAAALMSIQHDIKIHFQIIYDMIRNNYINEAREYIRDVGIIDEEPDEYISTGNIALDAIFNAKISRAEEKGIKVITDITVPNDLKITAVDTGILFGNLMDNAIESCERMGNAYKEIAVCIIFKRNHIVFRMENSTTDNEISLESSKSKGLHGIGVSNIKEIVEKYNGAINLYIEQGMFITELNLWNI